jgi:hypothetical protein
MKTRTHRPPLTDADLDRALAPASDSILPSSGFAASVMAAVHEEQAAPAPIAFPWKRALPGLIAVLAAIAVLIVAVPAALRSAVAAAQQHQAASSLQGSLTSLAHSSNPTTWISASVILSLACLLFCRKLITR